MWMWMCALWSLDGMDVLKEWSRVRLLIGGWEGHVDIFLRPRWMSNVTELDLFRWMDRWESNSGQV
jgi:hypothetical protein